MGSSSFLCDYEKIDNRPLKLKESACVEFIEDLPKFRGKFTFETQSSFNKIDKAALQFCTTHEIDKVYAPIISRLLAYNQHHYFAAFRQTPYQLRQQFIQQISLVDIELIDSLSNHFIRKQTKHMNPYTTIGRKQFDLACSIDLKGIQIQNKFNLKSEGLHLLRNGKVAILIMLAGHTQSNYHTSKALKILPLKQPSTVIQLMLQRLKNFLNDYDKTKQLKVDNIVVPIIFVCNEDNQSPFKKYIKEKQYFGLDQRWIKITSIKKWPIVNQTCQLCLSFQHKTLMWPQGSAKCLQVVLTKRFKSYLQYHKIQYLHIMGCENIAEFPGDPLLLGLTRKLNRKIAGKCVEAQSVHEDYPRYVSSKSNFHLLNMKQLQFIDNLQLTKKSPVALNSMVFHLETLFKIAESFEQDLYMSRRYHLVSTRQNYYDFQRKIPVVGARCFAFEKDLRDYISCSQEAILVRYDRSAFFPLNSHEGNSSIWDRYQNHLDEVKSNCLAYPALN